MASIETAYKVVYRSLMGGDDRYSLHVDRDLQVIYKVDFYSQACDKALNKGYGILCFDTLDNALQYRKQIDPFKVNTASYPIYRVIGYHPMGLPPRLAFPEAYAYFYGDDSKYLESSYAWPDGTVMYKFIKLLEQEV